jgi:hypothetical protein
MSRGTGQNSHFICKRISWKQKPEEESQKAGKQ